MTRVEDDLVAGITGPARRAELVAGPTRDAGHVRRLVVERPAERVAEDEQARVGRPVSRPRTDRGASERPSDGRGEAPRVPRDVHRGREDSGADEEGVPVAAASIAASVATDLETASTLETGSAERKHPRATGKDRRPAMVLGLVVVGALRLLHPARDGLSTGRVSIRTRSAT